MNSGRTGTRTLTWRELDVVFVLTWRIWYVNVPCAFLPKLVSVYELALVVVAITWLLRMICTWPLVAGLQLRLTRGLRAVVVTLDESVMGTVTDTVCDVVPVAPPWTWTLLAAALLGAHWFTRRRSGLS